MAKKSDTKPTLTFNINLNEPTPKLKILVHNHHTKSRRFLMALASEQYEKTIDEGFLFDRHDPDPFTAMVPIGNQPEFSGLVSSTTSVDELGALLPLLNVTGALHGKYHPYLDHRHNTNESVELFNEAITAYGVIAKEMSNPEPVTADTLSAALCTLTHSKNNLPGSVFSAVVLGNDIFLPSSERLNQVAYLYQTTDVFDGTTAVGVGNNKAINNKLFVDGVEVAGKKIPFWADICRLSLFGSRGLRHAKMVGKNVEYVGDYTPAEVQVALLAMFDQYRVHANKQGK